MEAPGTAVPERQKILFTLGFLSAVKIKLKCLLKRGRGVQDREKLTDRVRWSDLKSSFNSRIRMGVITNLEHVDTDKFMKDCAALFQPRIKHILQVEQNAVKVHTVLTAKFVISKKNEEIIEMKHFNTKAEPIYPTMNAKEWFITHVQEPIQTEIEEFEQQGSGWSLHSIINLTSSARCEEARTWIYRQKFETKWPALTYKTMKTCALSGLSCLHCILRVLRGVFPSTEDTTVN